jgi:4-hydroxy-tetrahydrodipicolinate synthase
MRLDTTANGVYVIAPTPFHDTGAIDEAATDRMVDAFLGAGATGLTILGIMGEAPKLTHAESLSFVRRVLARVKSRVPVVVGVSSPGFAAMKELSTAAMGEGSAGVMIAPPASVRTDDQIVNYFAQAVDAIGAETPWVLQDFPLVTTVQMAPSVIKRIVKAHASCVMLKHEDWPGLDKITTIRKWEAAGEANRISILCGNGGLFLDYEMVRGADGAMTGYAFPEMLVGVVNAMKAGKREEAHDLFDRHLPLVRYEGQPGLGLAVRKYVLKKRGILASDAQRKPAGKLSAETIADIEHTLSRLGADALRVAA